MLQGSLVPHAGDPDLGLLHVVGRQAGGVQHGLRRPLGFRLRDVRRVLVEHVSVGWKGPREGWSPSPLAIGNGEWAMITRTQGGSIGFAGWGRREGLRLKTEGRGGPPKIAALTGSRGTLVGMQGGNALCPPEAWPSRAV